MESALYHRKACRKLAQLWSVPFDPRKVCRRLAEPRRVRFDHHNVCRRLAELWKMRFNHRKVCICGLKMLRECVLTTAKRVVSLQSFGKCIHHCKAYRRLAVVWRVRFDHPKAYRRLA